MHNTHHKISMRSFAMFPMKWENYDIKYDLYINLCNQNKFIACTCH